MRQIALLSVLLGISAGIGIADPDPLCVSTSLDASGRLLLIPDNDGTNPSDLGNFTVTIKNNACNPINNAVVEVLVNGQAAGRTKLCGSAVWTKYSDPFGVVQFNIPGGGCTKGQGAVVIRANGVVVREFNSVMSPDYAFLDNVGQPNKWSLSITAADFASFAAAFHNGGVSCHDYDNNGTTGASDFAVFGQVWSSGTRSCSP